MNFVRSKFFSRFILSLFSFIISITAIVYFSGDSLFNTKLIDHKVNDVTGLNPIYVSRIVKPTSLEEIIREVTDSEGAISIGGGRNSQGGQTATENSVHFDMRSFNKVLSFNKIEKTITVQPGISWRKIQSYIDPFNLSVKIMQTYANFTVGGSLSVNVHGRYMGEGPIVKSVKEISLVLGDGSLIIASPSSNSDYFYNAIGGYGGIGIIVSATLNLANNVKIKRKTKKIKTSEYSKYFHKNIRNNKKIIMHNADLYPPHFDNALDVSWYETDDKLTNNERVIPEDREYKLLPKLINLSSSLPFGPQVREYLFDPYYYSKPRVVWRNWEASYDIKELSSGTNDKYTYVLNEYFVPVKEFDNFLSKLKTIYSKYDVNIINVSIRHAFKDPGSTMAWAREEVFAFVCYHRQGIDDLSKEEVGNWSREIVDAVTAVGGTYYLPYQIHATNEQFKKSYPDFNKFFKFKSKVDPLNRFQNKLWNKYYPSKQNVIERYLSKASSYYKSEEQTILTIPEWYLVFNPVEYANFLKVKTNNPSNFPFFKSIDEYWTLFDRVNSLVDGIYPENSEYQTMLWVIGVSTTIEYSIKGLYENSIGRFFRWTASSSTNEEDVIFRAHEAYSKLIFEKAWYEFDFYSWVKKVWSTSFFGPNFLRKTERKVSFTAEFFVKSIYAKLIGFASSAAYDPSTGLVMMMVKTNINLTKVSDKVQVIKEFSDNKKLISVPRWGGFSRLIPILSQKNVEFIEIAGNDEIALTIIRDGKNKLNLANSRTLFESKLVTDEKKVRDVLLVPVKKLKEVTNSLLNMGITIEHFYDY